MTDLDPEMMGKVLTGLGLIVVLSMMMERALAVIYEWAPIEKVLTARKLRAPLAFLTAYLICVEMKFDMLMIMANQPNPVFSMYAVGTFVTAATIAGGSKGAITLFQDVLGFSKEGGGKTPGGDAGRAATASTAPVMTS